MKTLIFILLATSMLAPVDAAACTVPTPGCRGCSSGDPTSCNQCEAGYRMTITNSIGTCIMCPVGTGRDADLFPRREPSFCDIRCLAGCLFCGAAPKDCFGCIAGAKYTVADKFCQSCPAGTGRAIDTILQTADTTCDVTCSGDCKYCGDTPTACAGCYEGYKLNYAARTCTICPVGTWKAADLVAKSADTECSSSCTTGGLFCGTDRTLAYACQAGFSYNQLTKKCTPCPAGYTRLTDLGPLTVGTSCDIKCDTGCSLCGSSGSDCLGCSAGYFYDITTKKCSVCPQGKGIEADSSIRNDSSECDISCEFEGCHTCSSHKCLGCKPGFKWNELTGTCSSCEAGKGRAADSLVLPQASTTCDVECSGNCRFCGATQTECTGCFAGSRLDIETKSCISCPSGYSRAEDQNSQLEDTRCESKCRAGCGSCDPNTPDICLNCAAGYRSVFTGAQRMCIACAGGQGRGADEASNTVDTVCTVECVLGCETCSEDRQFCIACSSGYYMSEAGVCRLCKLGWGKPYDLYPATVSTTDGVAECSVECHIGCNSCERPGLNGCLNCNFHYWFDGLSTCTICNNGMTKYNDTTILKIPSSSSACSVNCNSGCLTCRGPLQNHCLRCREGYYTAGDGICRECPVGRGKLADATDRTTTSTVEAECNIVCYTGCRHCTGPNYNQCTSCQGGFRKTDNNECEQCGDGTGALAQSGIVGATQPSCTQTCHQACRICDYYGSQFNCMMCSAAHYMSREYLCLLCPQGKGKPKDSSLTWSTPTTSSACSITCDPSCRNCFDYGAGSCISCNAGYYWSAPGVCTACDPYSGTPLMTTINPTTLQTAAVCFPCSTYGNCQSCYGYSSSECSKCVAGYYMQYEGRCTTCPAGRGKLVDQYSFVISTTGGLAECSIICDQSCHNCLSSSPGQCLLCAAGYYFTAAGTCTACNAGFGKPADTNKYTVPTTSEAACTIPCNEACVKCSGYGSTGCVNCAKGYFYSAANTCTLCPVGRGKGDDSGVVTPNTDGTALCQVSCPNCLTCDQSGTCLMCDRGYYKPVSGSCLPCNAGFGKPADTSTLTIGKTHDAACYVTCPDACVTCFGWQPYQCLKCNTGYYKSGPTTCSLCPKGKGKDVDTNVIVPTGPVDADAACSVVCNVASNCLTCKDTAANSCLNCPESYYLDTDGACKLCQNGKRKDADTQIVLATNPTYVCTIPCDPSCKACQTNPPACVLCAAGYYWTAPGKCTVCNNQRGSDPSVFYVEPQVEDVTCYDCDPACLGCSGRTSNDCIRCRGGQYVAPGNVCTLCPTGTGKLPDAGAVYPSGSSGYYECYIGCHANCRNCYGSGANECTSCKPGFYFSGAGTCTQCPPFTGKPQDSVIQLTAADPLVVCSGCHKSCYSCSGPADYQCIQCAAGHYFSWNGYCVKCNPGSGKDRDLTIPNPPTNAGACTAICDPKCGICKGDSPLDCLNCAAGFWWAGNGVCTQCDDTQGKAADTDIQTTALTKDICTTDCDEACLTCSQIFSSSCVKCSAGFYRSGTTTCSICPVRKGKDKDLTFTQVSSSGGNSECQTACHPSCRTCHDATAQGCLNCNEAYFMAQLGVCQLCAAGSGKPFDTVMVTAIQPPATCISCDKSCVHCSGTGPTKCLNCNAGMYLNNIGTCGRCPDGRGKAADTQFAVLRTPNSDGTQECDIRCHASCNVCSGPTENDCLNCNAGYYFGGNGKCLPCGLGKGKLADVPLILTAQLPAVCSITCDATCKNCIGESSTSCLSCAGSFYKASPGVCTRCPAKKGKRVDQSVFTEATTADVGCDITCAYPCSVCSDSDANSCITCTAGYYLQSAGKCTKCPFGKGKTSDLLAPELSTTAGVAECTTGCHPTCSSCGDVTATGCIGCSQGFFWENGVCKNCPMSTSMPQSDTTGYKFAQTSSICTLKCHPSCQMCSGPGELQCLNCSPGYWYAGQGKCQSCPSGRGKSADLDLFPTTASTEEACSIYCDICSSGCKTCTSDPFVCASCVSGRFLSTAGACAVCPDNCISCTEANKCDKCATNYKITPDGNKCEGDCKVEHCIECAEDASKCTKCNEEYVLKSETECIFDQGTVVVDELRLVSVLDSPQLSMDILSNKVELAFSSKESRNFTSLSVQDKLTGTVYTCQQISCAYAIKNDKLSLSFAPEFSIVQGKLTIERAGNGATAKTALWTDPQRPKRVLQSQANYPIVIDNIALMKQSYLNTMSFALRITVGVLRLPLSLVVFWKYPHLAMIMDHMVTHLKIYSLLGQPYMAYVEVVYQSVSDSKVLPFNFANPFEIWNPETLDCEGYPGIRCKNLHCSWLDNYGSNFIGLLGVVTLIFILREVARRLALSSKDASLQKLVFAGVYESYGLKYLVAKLDGNHVEIVLMTVIAYCTAEASSKSVVGLVIGTLALAAYGVITLHVTWESKRIHKTKITQMIREKDQHAPEDNIRLQVLRENNSPTYYPSQTTNEKLKSLKLSEYNVATSLEFALNASSIPNNKWSVYFFAARYVRALLLAVFVTTVRDPVEQVVLVVVLESVYLVALILLDFRGSRVERLFYTVMHALMLLHLILRAVATSKSLSDRDVQSSLAAAIVVVLMVYIFAHVIAALLVLAGIFKKSELNSPGLPNSSKIEIIQSEAVLSPSPGAKTAAQTRDPVFVLPAGPRLSYRDMEIPEEGREGPFEADIPAEDHGSPRASKIEHIKVRVEVSKPTAPGTLATDNHE